MQFKLNTLTQSFQNIFYNKFKLFFQKKHLLKYLIQMYS